MDSGIAPSARPGMTAESFSSTCYRFFFFFVVDFFVAKIAFQLSL